MKIRHGSGAYEVELLSFAQAAEAISSDSFIITDRTVAELYGHAFDHNRLLALEPGERTKRLSALEHCLEWLASCGAKRNIEIVALGGGVIGDLAGFVAAAYMRGIPYIQVPTTLMAQVDSSIGGKVGVDLNAGKNLAGAFYPPGHVFLCPDVLATLDDRQFNNGMAEVWKYAFIADPGLSKRIACRRPSGRDLDSLVLRCVEIKAHYVEEDEFERTGLRAALNFGHTVGHAIEKVMDYSGLLHGEAISIGMVAEAMLGEALGITLAGTAAEVKSNLAHQGLPIKMPGGIPLARLLQAMQADKKRDGDGLAFSLLIRMGECKLVQGVHVNDVERALNTL